MASSSYTDYLKPRPHEATLRLRNNILGLLTLTLLTAILPLPSPLSACVTVFDLHLFSRRRSRHAIMDGEGEEMSAAMWGVCLFEVLITALFTLNILQASYALKYPAKSALASSRAPARPSPFSPSVSASEKGKVGTGGARDSPLAALAASVRGEPGEEPSKRRGVGISASSPLTRSPLSQSQQRPFSTSLSASSTPASTPSRGTLSYSLASSNSKSRNERTVEDSPWNTSLNSSMSSYISTPSASPLAAFKGRYVVGGGAGGGGSGLGGSVNSRPVDGSLLARMRAASDDDDED